MHLDAVLTPIAAFVEVIAARRASLFEPAVRAAHEAGATRDTLLMAVDVARQLALAPVPVAAEAYAAAHRWSRMAARPGPAAAHLSSRLMPPPSRFDC